MLKHELLSAHALRTKKLSKWALRNRTWPGQFQTIVNAAIRKHPDDLLKARNMAELGIRRKLPSYNEQAIENALAEVERQWWCNKSTPKVNIDLAARMVRPQPRFRGLAGG